MVYFSIACKGRLYDLNNKHISNVSDRLTRTLQILPGNVITSYSYKTSILLLYTGLFVEVKGKNSMMLRQIPYRVKFVGLNVQRLSDLLVVQKSGTGRQLWKKIAFNSGEISDFDESELTQEHIVFEKDNELITDIRPFVISESIESDGFSQIELRKNLNFALASVNQGQTTSLVRGQFLANVWQEQTLDSASSSLFENEIPQLASNQFLSSPVTAIQTNNNIFENDASVSSSSVESISDKFLNKNMPEKENSVLNLSANERFYDNGCAVSETQNVEKNFSSDKETATHNAEFEVEPNSVFDSASSSPQKNVSIHQSRALPVTSHSVEERDGLMFFIENHSVLNKFKKEILDCLNIDDIISYTLEELAKFFVELLNFSEVNSRICANILKRKFNKK